MLRPASVFRTLACLALAAGFLAASVSRAQDDAESRRAAIEGIYPAMIAALEMKNFGRARNICDQAILWEPQNPVHHYNLACIEAQAGGTRLPYALGALELAVTLGFNDAEHMQADPDLAPLRGDPKFAALVRKAAFSTLAADVVDAIRIPAPKADAAAPSPAANALAPDLPPAATFKDGVPVGLFFLSRYWPLTHALEKAAWYFAPDGRVYRNLATGFSPADLGAHTGGQGTAKLTGHTLRLAWSDGTESAAEIERESAGFTWDRGIFTAVAPFEDGAALAGIYDRVDSTDTGTPSLLVFQRLELRADGTFASARPAFASAAPAAGAPPRSDPPLSGRWQLHGFSLTLSPEKGDALRGLAFPCDDEKTPLKPDQLFFRGALYRRQP